MATLAVDLVAGMLGDGVVGGEENGAITDEVIEDPTGQGATEGTKGPASGGEDAVVGGGVARGEGAEGAQEVGDGGGADGEDGGDSQKRETEESGLGERGGEEGEEGAEGVGEQADVGVEMTADTRRLGVTATAEFAAFALGQLLALLRR